MGTAWADRQTRLEYSDGKGVTYTYDPVGNRFTKPGGGTTTTQTYDNANQLNTEVTSSARTTFTFDNNGNTQVENAGGQRTTYTWNIENMCVGIALPTGTLNTFTYDADLVRRQAEDSTGLVKFVNDEQNVLLETDSGGTTQAAYTLEPAGYGNLISQRRSEATSFHHFDSLGSTDRLTDSNQAELASYVRTAFGVPKATTGNHPNRLTFGGRQGYRWEPDTGQYDVRRRRLATTRGVWASCDPERQGVAWYTYAWNLPVALTDPSGLENCEFCDIPVPLWKFTPGAEVCLECYKMACCEGTCAWGAFNFSAGLDISVIWNLISKLKTIGKVVKYVLDALTNVNNLLLGCLHEPKMPEKCQRCCPPFVGTRMRGRICVRGCFYKWGCQACYEFDPYGREFTSGCGRCSGFAVAASVSLGVRDCSGSGV